MNRISANCRRAFLAATLCALAPLLSGESPAAPLANWDRLASLPDAEGFAGPFAGISGGALIVAGGANFPDKKPWEGGEKIWHADIFILEKLDGAWRRFGKLPQPLAYGVSVTHARGLLCIGGSDATQHVASTLGLRWTKGRVELESLAPLPHPLANASGALIGDTVYVAGGATDPNATNASHAFFAMNLSLKSPAWQALEPWPGPGRILATAGTHDGSFHLFGGAALKAGPDGRPVREWLRDAYRYTPGAGWKRIADLPRAAVAAPSPAPVVTGRLLILGGDDGTQLNVPPAEHLGFQRDVLGYDPRTDAWERAGALPFSLVTTPAIQWHNRIVIPGGETRPGVRSTDVWAAPFR